MEFILTFLIVFFILSWLFGKFFPRILSWWLRRRVGKMADGFGGFSQDASRWQGSQSRTDGRIRREKEQAGKVTISRIEDTGKIIEKDVGEYIDFEEEPQKEMEKDQ